MAPMNPRPTFTNRCSFALAVGLVLALAIEWL